MGRQTWPRNSGSSRNTANKFYRVLVQKDQWSYQIRVLKTSRVNSNMASPAKFAYNEKTQIFLQYHKLQYINFYYELYTTIKIRMANLPVSQLNIENEGI